ncbi:DUF917 family protein [Clostridium sp. PL3]|uniref:DUF917 family protein n=1 Tax=Clostridium thailandense TaxID=2794346 RepID=A0A949X4F2_9CLOT|nr:DUF917 domain-containing protein [Clostridium thailandense]MBV7273888.1 DUF917 family protein [Clostridium thailandense]
MEKKLTCLVKKDMEYIIQGAAFLGSGGGGGIEDAHIIEENIFTNTSYVEIKNVSDVKSGESGAVVALMGAPSALKESADFTSPKRAFELLQQIKGNNFSYCLPIEVGAVNSLVPMLVASQLGIPVIDADGAGRAVPQLETTTLAMANISPSPAALVNSITEKFPSYAVSISLDKVKLPDGKAQADLMEEAARNMIDLKDFGQVGALSMYYIPQSKLEEGVIPDTLKYAHNIGKVIVDGSQTGKSIENLKSWFKNNKIKYFTFDESEVIEVKAASSGQGGGFNIGIVKVKNKSGDVVTINYENENLFAYLNENTKNPWAMAPDLICYMTDKGALSNMEIKKGQTVTIFGLPCNSKMRRKFITDRFMQILKSLKIYDGSYIPIEIIHRRG